MGLLIIITIVITIGLQIFISVAYFIQKMKLNWWENLSKT